MALPHGVDITINTHGALAGLVRLCLECTVGSCSEVQRGKSDKNEEEFYPCQVSRQKKIALFAQTVESAEAMGKIAAHE